MKIGRYLLSISLAMVLTGCSFLNNITHRSSSSSSSSFPTSQTGDSGGGGSSSGGSSSGSGSDSSSGSGTDEVESVHINAPKTELDLYETVTFSADVYPSDMNSRTVKWTSSNQSVAMVGALTGVVTAQSAGTTVIKATSLIDQTKFDTVTIRVRNEMIVVTTDTFDTNATYKLGYCYFPEYSSYPYYYYVNGEITNTDGPCLALNSNWDDGVDAKIEGTEDHYHIALFINGEKKYINTVSDVDYHCSIDSLPVNDWSWDETYLTFTTIVNGTKYFVGHSYSTSYIKMIDYSNISFNYMVLSLLIKTEKMDPTSISIKEDGMKVVAGNYYYLHAKVSPLGASLTRPTWSVLDNENVIINSQGQVTIKASAKHKTTVTIQAECGSSVVGTCVLSIISYGSSDYPLTVNEARSLIDDGDAEGHTIYITGIVTSNTAINYSRWESIVLTNDDGSVANAFYIKDAYGYSNYQSIYPEANSLYGKRVVVYGLGIYESSKYQLNSSSLNSVSNGNVAVTDFSISPGWSEIEQGKSKTFDITTSPYGSVGTFSWSISPSTEEITFDGKTLNVPMSAQTGNYTLTVTLTSANPAVSHSINFSVIPTTIEIFSKVESTWTPMAGDIIAIVSENYSKAMSATQNSNNRGQTTITISNYSFQGDTSVARFRLGTNGSYPGKFSLQDMSTPSDYYGYYLAADGGSSSNYLRSYSEANSAKFFFEISYNSINATSVTRGVMKYNQTNSIFSCYSSSTASSYESISVYLLTSA